MDSGSASNFAVHLTHQEKLKLVKFIRDNQATLMGKQGPQNTNNDRKAKWNEIFEDLKSKGVALKDLAHFRKDVWGNIRKAAIDKKDKNAKTGAKPVELTEVDIIALEIINPIYTDGLGLPDRMTSFEPLPGGSQWAGARPDGDLSLMDMSMDSVFHSEASFATPRAPPPRQTERASTPVNSEAEENRSAPNAISDRVAKRKRQPSSLLFDEEYKALKMRMDKEEQVLRMELLRCQVAESRQKREESQERTTFYKKAGITLDHQGSSASFVIQVPNELNFEI